jgi:SRSO17 transposase
MAPLAERAGLMSHDALHHFIAVGPWNEALLEDELARVADELVGGQGAFLIVDDTALPKKGTASVGVAPHYASVLGRACQLPDARLAHLVIGRGARARGAAPVPSRGVDV